jgi:hypothetical protein
MSAGNIFQNLILVKKIPWTKLRFLVAILIENCYIKDVWASVCRLIIIRQTHHPKKSYTIPWKKIIQAVFCRFFGILKRK